MTIHPPLQPTPQSASQSASHAAQASPAVAGEARLINFRNPALGGLIWMVSRPRSAFALPVLISPAATPTDQALFEEPQPGGPQHYLPSFKLADTGSGNQTQFAVSLAVSSSGYLLSVTLADATAMSVMSNRKREMPATRYMLQATLPGRTEEWDFPNATVDGTSITLTMPFSDPAVRDAIYTAMTDQSLQTKLILRRSPVLALPVPMAAPAAGQPAPQQLYRQSAVAIDSAIDFYFDKNLDQNVFANLPQTGGGKPSALHPTTVAYAANGAVGAKSYPYWQDPLQTGQIYFLPDAYAIARLASSPHSPALNITTSGSDPATLSITLTFLALPVWDPGRVAAAASAPAGPLLSNFGISKITSLSILPATTTQLVLNLPSTDPSAGNAPVPVANATIDTANGIRGSVTLSLAQFQQVYDALFVTPSVLLSGKVNVTVDQDTEPVPFSGSASDFAGNILDTSLSYDPSANQLSVVATNAIESPIQVTALPVTLSQGGSTVSMNVASISPNLPVTLQPLPRASAAAPAATPADGAESSAGTSAVAATPPPSSVTLVLQLAAGQAIDQSSKVELSMTQVRVNPDKAAIWDAIVQNQVVAPVTKQITLQLPAEVFLPQSASVTGATGSASSTSAAGSTAGSAAASGSGALLAVQVVFENGQTVTFLPSMTATGGLYTQSIGLNVDIKNYVLGQGDSSSYTYRVDTITGSGTQQGGWITTNVDDLFVTLGN